MNNNLAYATAVTPTPGSAWLNMTDEQRLDTVKKTLAASSLDSKNLLEVTAAKRDGQVIVNFLEPVGPDRRGMTLLDLEEYFKGSVDNSITVWLEPLGDRSSLRNLRGIEVKA
jgi:hypothetical protein